MSGSRGVPYRSESDAGLMAIYVESHARVLLQHLEQSQFAQNEPVVSLGLVGRSTRRASAAHGRAERTARITYLRLVPSVAENEKAKGPYLRRRWMGMACSQKSSERSSSPKTKLKNSTITCLLRSCVRVVPCQIRFGDMQHKQHLLTCTTPPPCLAWLVAWLVECSARARMFKPPTRLVELIEGDCTLSVRAII
jgi:hypothetical protein